MREPIAKEYLMLTSKWEEASTEIITKNTEKYLIEKYPKCKVRSVMYDKLSDMTGSSKHTVYAWFNKSRENVKIPLNKLCSIAIALHIDIMIFLTEDEINEEVCNQTDQE